MIRAYVVVMVRDSPLPDLRRFTDLCSKEAIKLTENNREFYITIEDTDHSFKVVGNVQNVDKLANGLVRIGFTTPNIDIVILGDTVCNPRDIERFVYTVEGIKNIKLPPQKCTDASHEKILSCICKGPKFSKHKDDHVSDYGCPFAVLEADLCEVCCYKDLEYYNGEDACKIIKSWKTDLWIEDCTMPAPNITLKTYPYLRRLVLCRNNIVEIPEAFGSLPCLRELLLTWNRLEHATNWNCLTTPFMRENLDSLFLDSNELSSVPELIAGLRNLWRLILDHNCLTELPTGFGHLKKLRDLHLTGNKLQNLPSWLYRKERFKFLSLESNEELAIDHPERLKLQLSIKDFANNPVPSLLDTVCKCIIIERIAYWKYNLPTHLADYLEGGYYCRCGSVVFRGIIGRVLQCYILTKALAKCYDGYRHVPISIRCCSYECYKLIEPYIIF